MAWLEEPTKYQERIEPGDKCKFCGDLRQVHLRGLGEGGRMSSAVGDCWKAFEWRDMNSIRIALEVQ